MTGSPFPVLPLNARILILAPIGLGNFIMATPALALLSRHFGPENLGLLALRGGIAEMARKSGWFGEVHAWDPDKQGLGRGWAVLSAIRARKYSHSLSLFPTFHWKFGAFALATGIPCRVGFRHPQGQPLSFFSEPFHQALRADPALHDTDQNLRLVEACIGRRHPGPIRLSWPLPAGPWDGGPRGAYAVVHPGSSVERGMADKRLPPEVFADLILRLHGAFGLPSVLVGGPEEAGLREDIRKAMMAKTGGMAGPALLAAETRNLGELGSLIASASLYLGNDSGIMHIAAALGIPCAAVFGPTDARRTGPYGAEDRLPAADGDRPRHLIVRRRDLPCQPCRTGMQVGKNPPCVTADIRCLRRFDAEDAWSQIEPFARRVLD